MSEYGYFAIGLLLVAGGFGAPVPEELLQLSAGYLARRGTLSFVPTLLAVYFGMVAGDALFFVVARSQGRRLLERRSVARLLTPGRRALLERHFRRHAFLTIAFARHASGLRLPAFALGAVNGVRLRTFLLADALSASLSVPLVVSLGYFFAAHIEDAKKRFHQIELALLALALTAAIVVVVVKRFRAARLPLPGER